MVDVVANHMASDENATSVNYEVLIPFDDERFFHNVCWINNYQNQTDVENVSMISFKNLSF